MKVAGSAAPPSATLAVVAVIEKTKPISVLAAMVAVVETPREITRPAASGDSPSTMLKASAPSAM